MPNGIFTASGVWFRTTTKALHAYAGPLLAQVSLAQLLGAAEVWIRSSQTLVLWLLPVLLWTMAPLPAALVGVVVYIAWQVVGPSFVTLLLAAVFRVLDRVPLQAVYYLVFLSWMGMQERYAALGVGLAGFVLLRWGLLQLATGRLLERLWASLYRLPVADQVLRAFIIRYALKQGVSLPELDLMEQQILQTWNYKRRRNP